MKSIQEIIALSTQYLQERGLTRARRLVEELLSHVLQCKRLDLYLQFDRPVEEKELGQMRTHLARIAKGEPIEYVIGHVEFFGVPLQIDPRVFIPRQETEILADWVAKRLRGVILWDLCAGSGALGISLKKKLPHLQVTLADLSREAISLAQVNAHNNGVEVECLIGDLFAPFEGKQADAVVCNPPYIAEREYPRLSKSVADYEPKSALIAGEKGTEVYERLAQEALHHLKSGGQLFLEIGATQGNVVKEIFHFPAWSEGELLLDWSGKDRFFFLEKQ